MTARSVSVELTLRVQNYIAGLRTAAGQTKQFSDELAKSHQASKKLSDGMLVAGGALAGGFLLAAKAAADFDQQMSHVNAVTNGSAKELDGLRTAAIAAGKDTQYSATQAAQAEEELAKAGIKTADIIGGGLTGSLNLAAAGSVDLAEAADIAAKAMNTFGLTGKDVPHIADVLAASANKSATDVSELGMALKQGGLAAHNSGLTLEDTVGTLSAFADRALVGSDAGTSLKTMLQAIAAPSKKASEEMQRLGINAYDAQGNFVGMGRFAGILQDKLGTLSQQERTAALATIFGSDATRAATVLYENGSDGMYKYTAAVDDSGAAAETAAKKTDNLAGDLERLKGSLETVAIQAGSGTNTGLRTLTQTAGGAVDAFGSLPAPIQTTLTVLAGLSGAGLLAAGGLLKAKTTVAESLTALRDMGPAGEKAAGGLTKLGKVAGALTIAGVAAALGYEGIKAFVSFLNSDVAPAKRNVDDLTRALKELAATGKVTGELEKAFGKGLAGLGQQYDTFKKSLGDLDVGLRNTSNGLADLGHGMVEQQEEMSGLNDEARKNVAQFQENTKSVDAALAQLVTSGGAVQAKMAFDQMAEAWVKSGHNLNDLIALFPQYAAAASGAAAANSQMGQGFGTAEQNARTLKQSMTDLISAGLSVIDIFNQLNGAQLGVNEAFIAAEASVDNLDESIKKNGKSLDLHTAAGRANQSALDDLARKAAQAAQAIFDQTGSVDAAKAKFAEYRQKMVEAYMAMGKSRAEAEALASSLMSLPATITTTVTTKYVTVGSPTNVYTDKGQRRTGSSRNPNEAHGGVLSFYADGGYSGAAWSSDAAHIAQIAPAGAWRTWAEPETGGEGYIPLAESKRTRSIAVLADINRRFGNPLGGGTAHAVEVNPVFQITLAATDPLGQALLGMVDVRIQRAQTTTARAVATGVRA